MQRFVRPQTLSRVLRTSTTVPRLVLPPLRSFSAITDSHNTAQPSVRDIDLYAVPPDRESIISKYGWYPVAGLLGSILVSKEILRINEDIFLAINYALVIFCAYVGIGDKIGAEFKKEVDGEEKYYMDATEFELALIEEAIKINDATIAKPEVIENYLKQYEEASVHYEKAQRLLVQLALRNSAEAKLQAARDREVRLERETKEKLAKGARAWLLARFQSSPQLKAAAIDRALQNLGKSVSAIPVEQDPIKQLFRDYISEAKRSVK